MGLVALLSWSFPFFGFLALWVVNEGEESYWFGEVSRFEVIRIGYRHHQVCCYTREGLLHFVFVR